MLGTLHGNVCSITMTTWYVFFSVCCLLFLINDISTPGFRADSSWRDTNSVVADSCCCLDIKPFFLPNIISSTPRFLPDSSS